MEQHQPATVIVDPGNPMPPLGAAAAPTLPDQPSRRPMNAFLLFCKRHRTIVKEM